jgi:hypothetical protein
VDEQVGRTYLPSKGKPGGLLCGLCDGCANIPDVADRFDLMFFAGYSLAFV